MTFTFSFTCLRCYALSSFAFSHFIAARLEHVADWPGRQLLDADAPSRPLPWQTCLPDAATLRCIYSGLVSPSGRDMPSLAYNQAALLQLTMVFVSDAYPEQVAKVV